MVRRTGILFAPNSPYALQYFIYLFLQLYCPAFELVQRVQKYQKDYRKYESNIEESCRASASYYVALSQLYACIVNNISNRYETLSVHASNSDSSALCRCCLPCLDFYAVEFLILITSVMVPSCMNTHICISYQGFHASDIIKDLLLVWYWY